jgi:hypothetical protein
MDAVPMSTQMADKWSCCVQVLGGWTVSGRVGDHVQGTSKVYWQNYYI